MGTAQYEEERVLRIELAKMVGKTKDECKDWKNKYENEARLHVENLDDLKKKTSHQDIVKLGNELDRAKMDNEGLKRDKSKLEDELKAFKLENDALKKQLHEVEMANRKLAHDREELARAYKDTDALKVKFEQRVQELELELKKLGKSYEVNMRNKEDEFGGIGKKMIVEIESL